MNTMSLVISGWLAAAGRAGGNPCGWWVLSPAVINVVIAILVVVLVSFIVYSQWQKRIILRKNRILARKAEQTAHLIDIIRNEAAVFTSGMRPVEPDETKDTITEMTEKTENATAAGLAAPKTAEVEELEHTAQLKLLVETTISKEQLYLREHLTFKDLSAATGISQLRLHTLFGEDAPYMNLNEYVNRRFRIPRVLEMLREHPEYTVEAIAHECGYQNMKTFFNWFHRELGMTPREYCKAVEEGGELPGGFGKNDDYYPPHL